MWQGPFAWLCPAQGEKDLAEIDERQGPADLAQGERFDWLSPSQGNQDLGEKEEKNKDNAEAPNPQRFSEKARSS